MFIILLGIVIQSCSGTTYNNHGVSVQLFEWSWEDVANECETFLGPKGFKTVQVSPPMEHIKGDTWWTRYQPVSYKFVSRSGNETEFSSMIQRCKKAGVGIVVDAVINHMAAGSGVGTAGSEYGSRNYPGIYSQDDFHHNNGDSSKNCEVDDYSSKDNVQLCDLVGLPDLCTGCSNVQETIAGYLNSCIELGVVGFRVDAAKHQDANELSGIVDKLENGPYGDVYVAGEVISGANEGVTPDMYYDIGQVSEFTYADQLDSMIMSDNSMNSLQSFGEDWGMMPDQYAAVFLDNHDTQRNGQAQLTYKDESAYTFANMFMIAYPYGEVRLMSSYYFTDTDAGPPSVGVDGGNNCADNNNWVCEHRTTAVANLVQWRNLAGTSPIANWQCPDNKDRIAFSRNKTGFIALNRGSSSWNIQGLQTSLEAGLYCNVLVSDEVATCTDTVTVSDDGTVESSTSEVAHLNGIAIHTGAKNWAGCTELDALGRIDWDNSDTVKCSHFL